MGLLSSLLEAWDSLVMAVSNSCGTGTLKFDDVVGVLLGEEACRKPSGSAETSGSVLSVDRRGRSRNRDKKKMEGRNFVGRNLGILLPNTLYARSGGNKPFHIPNNMETYISVF